MTSAASPSRDGVQRREAEGRRGYRRSGRSSFLVKNRPARGVARVGWSSCRGVLNSGLAEFRHKLRETQPTTGYAIETTATKAAPAVNHPVTEVSPTATAPITVDMIASPLRSVADQPAALQLTTKPAGATFAVYPGTIADEAAPASAPLRTGTAPGTADDLRGGNYTIFFTKKACPTTGPKASLKPAKVRPSENASFNAEVRSPSVPNAPEILSGPVPLGFRPLP